MLAILEQGQSYYKKMIRVLIIHYVTFQKSLQRYCTTEKELLALILALQYFEIYVTTAKGPIVIFTDHNPLTVLHKIKNKNQRLMRWSLLLQQYCLDIRHIAKWPRQHYCRCLIKNWMICFPSRLI